ncbi:MAG: hypothetical protein A2040_19255 [Rhodocyclales bacterium GWA2_65_19]|nr:MAG: hypothetical protein A2040_19255 [Rhodocyclales bacterium GWA2_65_19]
MVARATTIRGGAGRDTYTIAQGPIIESTRRYLFGDGAAGNDDNRIDAARVGAGGTAINLGLDRHLRRKHTNETWRIAA